MQNINKLAQFIIHIIPILLGFPLFFISFIIMYLLTYKAELTEQDSLYIIFHLIPVPLSIMFIGKRLTKPTIYRMGRSALILCVLFYLIVLLSIYIGNNFWY